MLRAPPSPGPPIEPGTTGFLSVGDPAQGLMSLHEAQVSETPPAAAGLGECWLRLWRKQNPPGGSDEAALVDRGHGEESVWGSGHSLQRRAPRAGQSQGGCAEEAPGLGPPALPLVSPSRASQSEPGGAGADMRACLRMEGREGQGCPARRSWKRL